MKRTLVFAVILALLLPAAAFAAAEFSLGGFIKLDSYWDSTQNTKNINGVVQRNNNTAFHHGNVRFTAQGSRFNFTIKGPKVFGAQTTGFLEMDFDSTTDQNVSASNSYVPRLRHAMFRLNWPETELLFGQYWSIFSSWYAEAAEDGPFQLGGTPTARLPQIRVTQKFLGDWSVMGLVGQANNDTGVFSGFPYSNNANTGGNAETPQIQASLKYAHDWWGKAAYYGTPIPFTAQITGGWQRNKAGSTILGMNTISGVGAPGGGGRISNTYVDPWMAMGTLFIPVIPTHSANLAGTAHVLVQAWIGQGTNAFGFTGDQTVLFKANQFTPNVASTPWLFDAELLRRWGGFVEGQYYFNNQWYANVAWSLSKTLGINQGLANLNGIAQPQYSFNNANGQPGTINQLDFTLWYRPVTALKFGLQYAYAQSNFWTRTIANGANAQGVTSNRTNFGNEHRVEFAGYFYF